VERRTCPECGAEIRFTHEKEVDTTMVADMLRLAAVDGFDILVLVSGDADLAPAVENVRALGKKVYVATWGRTSLAARLRQAAFDHIDLQDGLNAFRRNEAEPLTSRERLVIEAALPVPAQQIGPTSAGNLEAEVEPANVSQGQVPLPIVVEGEESAAQATVLAELARAEAKFSGGYVGVSYFIKSWRSNLLDPDPSVRQRLVDQLVEEGHVQIYDAADGSKAMRRATRAVSA
jgi:hypothetical protein